MSRTGASLAPVFGSLRRPRGATPSYYIEYAIAGLGAVQLRCRALADPAAAVADLRRALALGARARLPDRFAAAGLHFGTDRRSVGAVARACRDLLDL